MMEREFVYIEPGNATLIKSGLEHLFSCLKEGFILDPTLKIIRLETAVIYHLVKYSPEELEALEVSEKQPEIVSVKSVPIGEIDAWLAEGYVVENLYAKTGTLVKKEVKRE